MIDYLKDSLTIVSALWHARKKLLVFFMAVFLITIVAGSIMYVVESPVNEGFNSIPHSVYWAVVTVTTVGYGDISPMTALGKIVASMLMLLGYCIIAVPTGIVSANIVRELKSHDANTQRCPNCFKMGHDTNASFCKYCGSHL